MGRTEFLSSVLQRDSTESPDIVGMLDAVDQHGSTPLDTAIRSGNAEAAVIIIRAGGRSTDPQLARYLGRMPESPFVDELRAQLIPPETGDAGQ